MIRIGIVGIGFMGYTHFEAARKLKGGRVTAIATRNPKKRAGDWRGIQGNFGPPAGKVDLKGVTAYESYQELLDDPAIDLVDICLPTDQHEEAVLAAVKAGKNVLVEKPIAVDMQAANRMVKAAEKSGVMLMVAHVLPFFPEFSWAADCINGGQYGKLLAAHFHRVICPPNWSDDMSNFRKLGGWGIDLHIHDNHYIRVLCGMPNSVFASGLLQKNLVNHVHSQYQFDDPGLAVSCVSGGIAASGYQFGHGFEIFLEEATLLYDFATLGGKPVLNRPATLVKQTGKVTTPKLKGGDSWCAAFTNELQQAVNAIKTGEPADMLDGSLARDALKMCYAEAKSIANHKVTKI